MREGEIAPVATPSARKSDPAAGTPNLSAKEEAVAKTMGRLIVIVPAVLVIFIGLYTGYAAGVQFGQSKTEAWLWSIGSMMLTGVIVAAAGLGPAPEDEPLAPLWLCARALPPRMPFAGLVLSP